MNFDPTKTKQLIRIDKTELRQYWHLVEPGLIYMLTERSAGDGFIAPDYFAALTSGNATLFMCSISRNDAPYADRASAISDSCGFIIVQQTNSYQETALHIWIACSNEHTNKGSSGSVMVAFDAELSEIARACNCTAVIFNSNREFWHKIAPRFGFEIEEVKWRRSV